jgi:hypothetical protein
VFVISIYRIIVILYTVEFSAAAGVRRTRILKQRSNVRVSEKTETLTIMPSRVRIIFSHHITPRVCYTVRAGSSKGRRTDVTPGRDLWLRLFSDLFSGFRFGPNLSKSVQNTRNLAFFVDPINEPHHLYLHR